MFSATRLTAFVCIALGITVQAAPAVVPALGLDTNNMLGADTNVGQLANLGLKGKAAAGATVGKRLLDCSDLILNDIADIDLAKREILENLVDTASGIESSFGLDVFGDVGLGTSTSNSTSNSTDVSASASASSSSSLLSGLGSLSGGAGLTTGISLHKRQFLEDLGLGTNLHPSLDDILSAIGFGGGSVNAGVSASASASASFTAGTDSSSTATEILSITATSTSVSASASATSSASTNLSGLDIESLLSQLSGGATFNKRQFLEDLGLGMNLHPSLDDILTAIGFGGGDVDAGVSATASDSTSSTQTVPTDILSITSTSTSVSASATATIGLNARA